MRGRKMCGGCASGEHTYHGIKGPCVEATGPRAPGEFDWPRCACPWRPVASDPFARHLIDVDDLFDRIPLPPTGIIYGIDADYLRIADDSGEWRRVLDADERW